MCCSLKEIYKKMGRGVVVWSYERRTWMDTRRYHGVKTNVALYDSWGWLLEIERKLEKCMREKSQRLDQRRGDVIGCILITEYNTVTILWSKKKQKISKIRAREIAIGKDNDHNCLAKRKPYWTLSPTAIVYCFMPRTFRDLSPEHCQRLGLRWYCLDHRSCHGLKGRQRHLYF